MKKQRQVLAVLMAGMMMAGILGGCGQKADPEPEKKEEAVQKEETSDKGVLMIGNHNQYGRYRTSGLSGTDF